MRVPRVAAILVFWLGALTLSVSTYNIINDHFDRISRARQIARYGELPFRDFFDPGYFMTEFSSAGLQLLFGDSLLGEMLLNTVFIATGATLVFVLARRAAASYLGGLTAHLPGLMAALLALFAMPRAYDFDKVLFYPLGIFLCWRYVDRPGVRRALELAVAIAIGALFRYDTGVYTGLAAVVTMLVLHWREPKVCAQRIGICGLTAVLAGLVVLIPIVGFGGVPDAIDQVVTYAVKERARTQVARAPRFSIGNFVGRASISSPEISVTVRWARIVSDIRRHEAEAKYGLNEGIPGDNPEDRTYRYTMSDPSATTIKELVKDLRVDDTAGIDRDRQSLPEEPLWIRAQRRFPALQLRVLPGAWNAGNATAFIYYFFWGMPFVAVIAVAIAWHAPWHTTQELARVGGLVAVCLALNLLVLREPIGARIGGIAGPMAILATSVAVRAWHARPLWPRLALSIVVIAIFALVVWSLGSIASWSERLVPALTAPIAEGRDVVRRLSVSPPRPEVVERGAFPRMVRYLRDCTSPTDKVLARWFVPELYFFARRGFAAAMVVTFGGHWSDERFEARSRRALESESVPIILALAGDERVREEYPLLTGYIDQHYKVAARTNFDSPSSDADGDYLVLVRIDRSPVKIDARTALPCFK
jgi:hypothetical protein